MADSSIGDPQDTKATNTTGSWSVIALLKKLIDTTASGSTDAVTVADGADVTEGTIADAAVAAGATGTISAKLRAISRDIVANIVLKAGSAIIGQVSVDQTTPGTTDSVTVKASVGIGSLTETAPATDTASSGLNGRLQRIAQRVTSLIAQFPTTLGQTTKAASLSVSVASDDDLQAKLGIVTETAPASDTASSGLNGRLQRIAQNISTLITSSLIAVGNVASGASDSGNPVKVGGRYNSTKPTLTNGQRGDIQLEINGSAAVSNYIQTTNPGDEVIKSDGSGTGTPRVALYNGGASLAVTGGNADAFSGAGVGFHNRSYTSLFNGSTWDRFRNLFSTIVLASAARTATVSTDITNYNGKTIAVVLNITAAPNTASTLTLQIRVKDSISGNYTTLLASAAIVGTATTGVVPVTNLYRVGQGITVTANISAADVLGRTLNVNMVHSNADSWTYSVSADIGN